MLRLNKISFSWIPLVLAALLVSSCRLNKDLNYISDTWPSKKLTGLPNAQSEYKIKVRDNIFVSIISSNTAMNEIYNPSNAGSTGSMNVNVWQTLAGQFLYGYLVEVDGTVSLPALGKIEVSGLTMQECEAKIKSKVEEYLKEVIVKVRLLSYKITVMGEVNSPGVYYNYNPEFTIFDALGSAGGLTPAARLDRVLVLRRTEDGSKTLTLNLQSESALASEGYFLEPNDVVVVSPALYRNAQLSLPFYSTLLTTLTTFMLVLNFIRN